MTALSDTLPGNDYCIYTLLQPENRVMKTTLKLLLSLFNNNNSCTSN